MQVTILKEEGYDLALRGMAYSFRDRAEDMQEWWSDKYERAVKRAPLLAPMDGGHNKFLRQICLWVDIEAPRAWWSEFDTYKVGTVAQSESTMHTLAKRMPEPSDFEEGTDEEVINRFQSVWRHAKGDVTTLKMNLPEGFLQRRLVTMNYANVKNIVEQREKHRLKLWPKFIDSLVEQLEHPELVGRPRPNPFIQTDSEGGEA